MGTLGSRSTYSTWGTRCGSPPRTREAKIAALARELGVPAGSNVPVAELFRQKYGMQAGNIVGTGSYVPELCPARQRPA